MYFHCNITVTSYWARWCLKSTASRLFTQPFGQAPIKENIKAPRHWPLWEKFTGGRGIHLWPLNFPPKRPVTRKMFPFDDVIMKLTSVACMESTAMCHILSLVKFRLTCSIDKIRNWPKVYWYHKQKWVNVKGVYTLSFSLFLNRSITLINKLLFRYWQFYHNGRLFHHTWKIITFH